MDELSVELRYSREHLAELELELSAIDDELQSPLDSLKEIQPAYDEMVELMGDDIERYRDFFLRIEMDFNRISSRVIPLSGIRAVKLKIIEAQREKVRLLEK